MKKKRITHKSVYIQTDDRSVTEFLHTHTHTPAWKRSWVSSFARLICVLFFFFFIVVVVVQRVARFGIISYIYEKKTTHVRVYPNAITRARERYWSARCVALSESVWPERERHGLLLLFAFAFLFPSTFFFHIPDVARFVYIFQIATHLFIHLPLLASSQLCLSRPFKNKKKKRFKRCRNKVTNNNTIHFVHHTIKIYKILSIPVK